MDYYIIPSEKRGQNPQWSEPKAIPGANRVITISNLSYSLLAVPSLGQALHLLILLKKDIEAQGEVKSPAWIHTTTVSVEIQRFKPKSFLLQSQCSSFNGNRKHLPGFSNAHWRPGSPLTVQCGQRFWLLQLVLLLMRISQTIKE